MAIGEEKLEFSMQDIGRLAVYLNSRSGSTLHIVLDWVGSQANTDAERVIYEGFNEEFDKK